MLKKRDRKRLEVKEKEWDEISAGINSSLIKFWKGIKREVNNFRNSMMYQKKQPDKINRFVEELVWWFKIGVIFFAFKGFTYWLTGR